MALEKRKRKPNRRRLWAGLLITVACLAVIAAWTVAVFRHDGLAWVFTGRWAALTALLSVAVPAYVLHLFIRSAPGAAERPSPADLSTPEVAASKILDFRRAGLKGLVVGADGRASMSQTQAVLWLGTLLFGLIFLLLLGRSPNCPFPGQPGSGSCATVPAGLSFPDTLGEDFPWEYLLLIGWPLAVAITARKQVLDGLRNLRQKGTPESETGHAGTPEAAGTPGNVPVDGRVTPIAVKSPPTTSEGLGFMAGLRDLFCNDRGHGSIMDIQVIGFTLVTIAYFLIEVLSHPEHGLPSIPPALLVLMGISGGGYLTAKAIDPLGTAGAAAPVDSLPRPAQFATPIPPAPIPAQAQAASPAPRPQRAEGDAPAGPRLGE